MHARAKEAEGTRTVRLFGGPEKSCMGPKQPPGERQFPQDRQALLPSGWGALVLCRGQESWKRHPHLISSPPETHQHPQPERGTAVGRVGCETLVCQLILKGGEGREMRGQ